MSIGTSSWSEDLTWWREGIHVIAMVIAINLSLIEKELILSIRGEIGRAHV